MKTLGRRMSKRNCFFLFWRFDYAALGLAEAVSQYYRSSLQTVIMKRMTIENQKLLLLKRHAFFFWFEKLKTQIHSSFSAVA